jgi:hypothetical protein
LLLLTEGSGEIFSSGNEDVGGCSKGHGEVVGKPVDSVCDADRIGGRDPYLVAAVVVETGADVVAASGVYCKRFSAFGAFVGENFDAGWGEWCLIKTESAVNLSVGRG